MTLKKLALLIPVHGSVPTGFFRSFVNVISQLGQFFQVSIIVNESSLVEVNRERILEKFLEQHAQFNFDYALWIDSDMRFTVQDIVNLVNRLDENHLDILGGLCFNIFENGKIYPVLMKKQPNNRYIGILKYERNSLVEVDSTGLAFLLVRSKVLKELKEKFSPVFEIKHFPDGYLLGEDVVFCEKAKQLGYRVLVDSAVSIGHLKGEINQQTFDSQQKL